PRAGAAGLDRRARGGAARGGRRVRPTGATTRRRAGSRAGPPAARRVPRGRGVGPRTGGGARQSVARVFAAVGGRRDDRRPAGAGRSFGAARPADGRAAWSRAAARRGGRRSHGDVAAAGLRSRGGTLARAARAEDTERLPRR